MSAAELLEAQWGRYTRHEQQLAQALYNGTDGMTKAPPFHSLTVEERQPHLDRARARMDSYLGDGRRGQ